MYIPAEEGRFSDGDDARRGTEILPAMADAERSPEATGMVPPTG